MTPHCELQEPSQNKCCCELHRHGVDFKTIACLDEPVNMHNYVMVSIENNDRLETFLLMLSRYFFRTNLG